MRPDVVIRTGVIEPFWTRMVSPVEVARHTIDPFIASVRPIGPAVAPSAPSAAPSPEEVAKVVVKAAEQLEKGKDARVRVAGNSVKITATTPSTPDIVGAIANAAQRLAKGQAVSVRVGPRQVLVCRCKGGHRIVRQPSPPVDVSVRPTPLPVPPTAVPMPRVTHPYHAYGRKIREQIFADKPEERHAIQVSMAQKYAPLAIQRAEAARPKGRGRVKAA